MWGWWFVWPLFLILLFWLWASWWWPSGYRGRRGAYSDEPWGYGAAGGGLRGYGARGRGAHRGKGPVGYQRSDDRIAEDVSDALMVNDDLDASAMTVAVKSGIVTLSGYAPTRSDKRLAETLAESVPGVTDVKNDLRIGAPPPPSEPQGQEGQPPQQGVPTMTHTPA